MLKRTAAFCLLLSLLLIFCSWAGAEDAEEMTNEKYSFQGAEWGMTKDQVRALVGLEPFQEPTAPSGHSALVYQTSLDGFKCVVQYNFLPEGTLFNIEIMAPDAEKALYTHLNELYTAQYGQPHTEENATLENEDPVDVMMALLMQSTQDADFLGWQGDEDTVLVMSFNPQFKVCYVEIRQYTNYFLFTPGPEQV